VTHTTAECMDLVQEILGKKARLQMLPPRPGDQQETSAHIAKARKLLGYAPKVDLKKGLENEVAWFKKHQDILLN